MPVKDHWASPVLASKVASVLTNRLLPSGRPCDQEIAADEVAIALAPAVSITFADTGSHALGRMIGSPGTCIRLKETAFVCPEQKEVIGVGQ